MKRNILWFFDNLKNIFTTLTPLQFYLRLSYLIKILYQQIVQKAPQLNIIRTSLHKNVYS